MIVKAILYFGVPNALACDAKCEKAWGINNRPRVRMSPDEDDYAFLADQELGIAPMDPGTYEGGHAKPTRAEDRLNKWCCRECERSVMVNARDGVVALKDFSRRRYNLPPTERSA